MRSLLTNSGESPTAMVVSVLTAALLPLLLAPSARTDEAPLVRINIFGADQPSDNNETLVEMQERLDNNTDRLDRAEEATAEVRETVKVLAKKLGTAGASLRAIRARLDLPPDGLLPPNTACPRPWLRVNEEVCVLAPFDAVTWQESARLCKDFGGRLASFSGTEDFDAAMRLTPFRFACTWVGLRVRKGEVWFEDDGTKKYTRGLRTHKDGCVVACDWAMQVKPCEEAHLRLCRR